MAVLLQVHDVEIEAEQSDVEEAGSVVGDERQAVAQGGRSYPSVLHVFGLVQIDAPAHDLGVDSHYGGRRVEDDRIGQELPDLGRAVGDDGFGQRPDEQLAGGLERDGRDMGRVEPWVRGAMEALLEELRDRAGVVKDGRLSHQGFRHWTKPCRRS